MKRAMLSATIVALGLASAHGAEPGPQAAEEEAIRQAVASYVAAFNEGDSKALAAMWSPEAVYSSPFSGAQVVGRAEIERQFADLFAEAKGIKLMAKTDSVQFISPSVAVENGTANVVRADQEPEESTYTAIYVKRDGKWLLDRVTEQDVPIIMSRYEQLKELEWMIGTWIDSDDQARIETTCQWTRNKNFINRSFAVSVRDRVELAGMQIIGWDPVAKQIRSWVFDSDGGFAEGRWSKKGKRWSITTTGITPDGLKSTSVNVITYVDDNQFKWQSVNRTVGGRLLPNVDEVVVVRSPSSE